VTKITHNAALSFHPIFIPLNQIDREILNLGFWITDLLYRFALSLLSHWGMGEKPSPLAAGS